MSENYFQHADHFTRILSEQEDPKKIQNVKKNQASIKSDDKSNRIVSEDEASNQTDSKKN